MLVPLNDKINKLSNVLHDKIKIIIKWQNTRKCKYATEITKKKLTELITKIFHFILKNEKIKYYKYSFSKEINIPGRGCCSLKLYFKRLLQLCITLIKPYFT